MENFNLPSQRERLESERRVLLEEIEAEVGQLKDQAKINHPRAFGGSMDDEVYDEVRDLTLRIGEHHYQRLRRIDLALAAIENGVFGVCIDCRKLIEADRLVVEPTAQRCIKCQVNAENDQDERDATPSL